MRRKISEMKVQMMEEEKVKKKKKSLATRGEMRKSKTTRFHYGFIREIWYRKG